MKPTIANRLAPLDRKERLFADFFQRMVHMTGQFETLLSVRGISESVFDGEEGNVDDSVQAAALRRHRTWALLSDLVDYALDGVAPTSNPDAYSNIVEQMVDESAGLLALLAGHHFGRSEGWDEVLQTADARQALDEGEPLHPESVALLGGVDLRTVRNAMSSGAITSDANQQIDNQSARAWLLGRKGYKPTVRSGTEALDLKAVQTPIDFSTMLRQQRERREREISGSDRVTSLLELLPANPGLTPAILAEVEEGLFRAPLSVVWPLADVYGLPRNDLLTCVMQVFFHEEFVALMSAKRPATGAASQE